MNIELAGYEEARNLFSVAKFNKANYRAVKKGTDKGFTELSRVLRRKWNIKAGVLAKSLHKRYSGGNEPRGYVTARSRPLSWRFFNPKTTAQGGVKVKITKTEGIHTAYDTFYAKSLSHGGYGWVSKSGAAHPRIRKRRSDAKHKTNQVRPRLPIVMHRVITVASMFEQTRAYGSVVKVAGDTWQKEFVRQLSL